MADCKAEHTSQPNMKYRICKYHKAYQNADNVHQILQDAKFLPNKHVVAELENVSYIGCSMKFMGFGLLVWFWKERFVPNSEFVSSILLD